MPLSSLHAASHEHAAPQCLMISAQIIMIAAPRTLFRGMFPSLDTCMACFKGYKVLSLESMLFQAKNMKWAGGDMMGSCRM